MANLKSSVLIGNSGVSSLLRSAASAATAVENLKTSIADQTWNDSAKTAQDYADYTAAINPLLKAHSSDTTTAGQQKVISLQNKLTSASSSYNTAQIDRVAIGIDQGTASQGDKVNLLGQLYMKAVDPAQQQRLLMQYDAAAVTLQNQNDAAAKSAASTANTNAQKGYTAAETMGAGLITQMNESIQTGKNQIDPALLTGSTTLYVDTKTNTAYASKDKAPAGANLKTVPINLGAKGTALNTVDLYHLMGIAMQLNAGTAYQASTDPNLNPDQQSLWANKYQTSLKELNSSIYTNQQLAVAEENHQPAIVRDYANGVASLVANPETLLVNPSPQELNSSLANAKKNGTELNTTFIQKAADGTPTVYKIHNIGNALVAFDASNVNQNAAQAFLYDPAKGALVPFNQQHQAEISAAMQSGGPNPYLNPNTVAVANGVQQAYGVTQQIKPGSAAAGATTQYAPGLGKGIQLVPPDVRDKIANANSYDPLGRTGSGVVGALGKAGAAFLHGLGGVGESITHDISSWFAPTKGAATLGPSILNLGKPLAAPVTHPNVPLPTAAAYAAPRTSTPVAAAGGLPGTSAYKQVADAKGGFNYFQGATPITVQQYNTGTGLNVSATARSGAAGAGTPDFLASVGM